MKLPLLIVALLISCNTIFAQNHKITGTITDRTGEVLIGAQVVNIYTGEKTVTDSYGFFQLFTTADSAQIAYSYLGISNISGKIYLETDTLLRLSLQIETNIEDVVIKAEKTITTKPGKLDIPVNATQKIPALLGEPDILKLLQYMPGIQQGAEGTADMLVRGGSPDQNLILADDAYLFQPSHMGGLVSVCNTDVGKTAQLFKSSFPARYGGKLSSVLEIRTIDGNTEKIKGHFSTGILASKITLDGPLTKSKKTTFVLGARRTMYDLLSVPVSVLLYDFSSGVYFYDINAKITHRFKNDSKLSVSMYAGKDKFFIRLKDNDLQSKSSITWGNSYMSAKYTSKTKNGLFSDMTAVATGYDFEASEFYKTTADEYNRQYLSSVKSYNLQEILTKKFSNLLKIETGIVYEFTQFNPSVLIDNKQITNDNLSLNAHSFAGFGDIFFNMNKIKIATGFRLSNYYTDNRFYTYPEPRISLNYTVFNTFSVFASYDRMTQLLRTLSSSLVGLPTDLFVPATRTSPPQTSDIYACGFKAHLKHFTLSYELFYKKMEDLVEYRQGASFLVFTTDWRDKIVTGQGISYGSELMIEKSSGKIHGWTSLNFSRSFRYFNDIDNGRKFPHKYDRPINLAVVIMYDFKTNISFSATWQYYSGANITQPESVYGMLNFFDPENQVFNYESFNYRLAYAEYYPGRNNYRLPAYHRLDIGCEFAKPKKRGVQTWYFGVYNVYNKKNAFTYLSAINQEGNEIETYRLTLFPFIPYFRYSFQF